MGKSVYKARKIENALLKKGFEQVQSDHRRLIYMVEGRRTRVTTKISHDRREYGGALLSKLRDQIGGLSMDEFDNLVECPMSPETYRTLLEARIPNFPH